MSSLLVFTPDLTQPLLTITAEITADQVAAMTAFMEDQNASTPGRYPTVLSLIASNQRTGLLAAVQSLFPSGSEAADMSGITFVPNAADPAANREDDTFTNNEMMSASSFLADQNVSTPGRYAGVFDLIMHDLHDALFGPILQIFPNATIISANAAVTAAQATVTAAFAGANPLQFVGVDPVTIPPVS